MRSLAAAAAVFALGMGACSTAGGEATPAPTPPPTTAAAATTVVTATSKAVTTTPTEAATTTVGAVTTTVTERPEPSPVDAGTFDVEMEVAGVSRSYVLTVPQDLAAGPVPVVVDLHGFTADPDSHDDLSSMRALAAREGFVVAQPSGLGEVSAWSAASNEQSALDVEFLIEVVADVSSRVPVDPARVYAMGFSNGGGMANRLACDAGDLFAAVASVAGAYVDHDECEPGQPVSILGFHGTDDIVVPYRGLLGLFPAVEEWAQDWAFRNGCAAEPEAAAASPDVTRRSWTGCDDGVAVVLYTIAEGGHGWPGSQSAERRQRSTDSVDASTIIWEFFVSADGASR